MGSGEVERVRGERRLSQTGLQGLRDFKTETSASAAAGGRRGGWRRAKRLGSTGNNLSSAVKEGTGGAVWRVKYVGGHGQEVEFWGCPGMPGRAGRSGMLGSRADDVGRTGQPWAVLLISCSLP